MCHLPELRGASYGMPGAPWAAHPLDQNILFMVNKTVDIF